MDTLVINTPDGLSLRVSQPEIHLYPLEKSVLGPIQGKSDEHPSDRDDTRAGLLKIAALYTMNIC